MYMPPIISGIIASLCLILFVLGIILSMNASTSGVEIIED